MTRSVDHPAAMDAEIDILFTGYAHPGEGGLHVAGTVGLVRDGEAVIVIDPGMVPSHRSILEPLAKLGLGPEAVNDVVFSHHHPDHTLSAAIFPGARFHDHWAIYQDRSRSRRIRGFPFGAAEAEPMVTSPATPIVQCLWTLDTLLDILHSWTRG